MKKLYCPKNLKQLFHLLLFPQYFDFSDLLAKGFIPYGVDEYKGNMAASIILIGTQIKLLNKIEYY